MRCPNCGAEIGEDKFCQYCGTQISYDMKREQEQLNKQGCPKCGSSNVQFNRENQGEIRDKRGKRIIHNTVGFCKDCGYTWYPPVNVETTAKKSPWWLWALGWIIIFPIPLTILLLRKKEMRPWLKYGLIALGWIVYFVWLGSPRSDETTETELHNETAIVTEAADDIGVQEETASVQESHIYDDAEVIDLISGDGTKKVGTITVTRCSQSECTEEVIADWYNNYVSRHEDSKYHVIIYTDNPGYGVYANISMIQKDVKLEKDTDGSYILGDDAGSTYYSMGDDGKLIKQMTMESEETLGSIKTRIEAVIPDTYKNGDMYGVDLAGTSGNLDCYITLVDASLWDADYESIALAITNDVKAMELGIGYYTIAFQSDDYVLRAMYSLDDLDEENPENGSTTVFEAKEDQATRSESETYEMVAAVMKASHPDEHIMAWADGSKLYIRYWQPDLGKDVQLAKTDADTAIAWGWVIDQMLQINSTYMDQLKEFGVKEPHCICEACESADGAGVQLVIEDGIITINRSDE